MNASQSREAPDSAGRVLYAYLSCFGSFFALDLAKGYHMLRSFVL